jgi:uncharacterized protein YbjT (DUF2867 family)
MEVQMILVTGGAGFIGSHIVKKLADGGKIIRVLIRDKTHTEHENRLRDLEVEWFEGDVLQPETLANAMQGVDTVIHTVAIAIEKGNLTFEKVNLEGTVNIVDAAIQANVKRFINLSQLGADPSLPYRLLASKGKAQAYVAKSKLNWTAFRPSVVWGPEDEFANTFARLVPLSPIIFPIIGDESSVFQPVWVGDVAETIVRALDDPKTIGKEFELGGPEILTLEEIERRTLAAVEARRVFIRFPLPLLRVIVALMEMVFPSPPVTHSLLELLAVSNVTNQNALTNFISEPRAFTSENVASYMQKFRVRDTLGQYFGR